MYCNDTNADTMAGTMKCHTKMELLNILYLPVCGESQMGWFCLVVELHWPGEGGKVCEEQGYPAQFNMGPGKAGGCSTNSAANPQFKEKTLKLLFLVIFWPIKKIRVKINFLYIYVFLVVVGWFFVLVGKKGMFMWTEALQMVELVGCGSVTNANGAYPVYRVFR